MKKKSILMVFALVMVSLLLCSCGFTPLSAMPALEDKVVGNGGVAVQKGDYVYFVDTVVDATALTKDDNTYNKVSEACIYRTKLVNGELDLDEKGILKSKELVVPKVVGFANTGLYIFDNYIYYGTPNMQYNSQGTLTNNLIDFCRARLDGSDVEQLYTTEQYPDGASHTFCKIGNSVYLLVWDTNKLVKVEVSNHISQPVVLAEDVDNVMFAQTNDYEYVASYAATGTEGYVYYTRNLKESDNFIVTTNKVNVLGRVNVKTGDKNEVIDGTTTHKLVSVESHYVYVERSVSGNTSVWATNFVKDIQVTATSTYSDVTPLNNVDGENRGVIVSYESNTVWIKDATDLSTSEVLLDKTITIEDVVGNYVYYIDGTKIYRLDLETKESELVVDDSNMDTVQLDLTDSKQIYYFATYTGDSGDSAKYLNRVNLNHKVTCEDAGEEGDEVSEDHEHGYKVELVGKLKSNHIVVEEDEE